MNSTPQQLTCYIKKTQANPETWEGFCIEVDIPAIGDTYEEVVGKMHQRLAAYIDFIHQRQPDDEQSLMFRPMPGGQAWKLKLEERFLQRLPFSKLQIRKTFVSSEQGIPAQLNPHHTELCFNCRKYRSVGLFEVYHEPNSAYVWYDKTCNLCKETGAT